MLCKTKSLQMLSSKQRRRRILVVQIVHVVHRCEDDIPLKWKNTKAVD